jgi:hypothetical protein
MPELEVVELGPRIAVSIGKVLFGAYQNRLDRCFRASWKLWAPLENDEVAFCLGGFWMQERAF